jgi:signal transduction histidine kinase/CheY-like chemotaxis protein/PAS domain-containing protein
VLPDDVPFIEKALQSILKTGQDKMLNYRVRHKDLGFVWLHAIYRYIGDLDGRPVLFATFLNSSAETKLFTQLLDNVKTAVFVVDHASYKILYANKAGLDYCQKGLDYSSEPCYSFIRGKNKVCEHCFFAGLKPGESAIQETYRESHHVWQSVQMERVDWCGHDAVIQTIEDITGYKNQQKRLQNQKSALEETIASIPVGISIFRKSGEEIRRISFNNEVSAIKGVSEKDLQKDTFEDIFKRVWPADKERVIQDTKDVFTKGHVISVYQTKNEKTGKYMWLRREGRAVPQEDGSMLAYFCYVDISAQMESEEALRESQGRYENAVKGGNIAVWEYDFSSGSLVSPEHSLDLLGIPNQLANLPESLFPYFLPYSHQDLVDQFTLLNKGVVPESKDLWLEPVKGNSACYRVTYTLIKDADGKPFKAYGVAQDITFEKRLEEEYSRLSSEFLSLNPGALCSFRLNLSANHCYGGHGSSAYIKRILNSSTATGFFSALMGLMTDPKDVEKAKEMLSIPALITYFHKGTKNLNLTYRRKMENSEQHWVTTYIALIQNPHTQDIEALLYSVDSNEAVIDKLIGERLTDENYEFTGLINIKTGKIAFHDAHLDATTPHETDDFDKDIALASEKIMNPENAKKMVEAINVSRIAHELESQNKYTFTFTIEKGPGKGQVKTMTFIYLDESHDEILLARNDISQVVQDEAAKAKMLQAALDEAKKANQLKTDFLSNVSHDMRTPLNGVIGYTDMALESEDPEKVKEYLRKIKKSGELLMSLINDTLDLSKIETGQIKIQKTPIVINELFQKIATSVAPSVEEKSLHFGFQITPDKPIEVSIDVLKVTEIVNNLLSNAIKFTPNGGHVNLSLAITKEKETSILTQIVVQDDGIGMSEAFLAKAYEPFSQEKTVKNAEILGSGLGLSIVHQLVHLMGGEVTIKSKLNEGTTITIVLPMDKATVALPKAAASSNDISKLKGKRVLLVEDNFMNAEIAKNVLSHYGLVVETAVNGVEAVSHFRVSSLNAYAAILMDIRMPVMNGFEAAKAIRSSGRADATIVPIIAMTADAYEDDVKRCLDAGMDAHVSKPIDRTALLAELTRLIK